MEYLIALLSMAGFVLVIFLMEVSRARKAEKKFIQSLYGDYGKLNQKEYSLERYEKMGSFYDRHREAGQIDDITWNDLGMDDLFKRMNYTFSASGEEYLYYTLRTPRQEGETLLHLEEVVGYFGSHPDERVRVQLQMHRLGHTGKYSLYDYLDNLETLGERKNTKSLLADLLYLPLIGLLGINLPLAVTGLVVLTIWNIMTYFKEKAQIDPYITSFAYVMRLLEACDALTRLEVPVCKAEREEMQLHGRNMKALKRNSFWVMAPGRGNASGNLLDVFMDYIRMIFHVDIIKFNRMLKHLRGHMEDVDALIGLVGFLETAIAVWAFRESLGEGYCVPCFTDSQEVCLQEAYHPLLEHAVKNSVTAKKGVLLTGSNASGKSTFLKTVALNAVLAQTIHTCTARGYQGTYFRIYSSMALRDDLGSGESYYIVEIKALKRILDSAGDGVCPVLCFVDEVLRGTNTVERIAASTQILRSLGRSGILCFAATHDIELTELLQGTFTNYHFEEEVSEGDIRFNYRLLPGRATTQNAIRLLELMGYEPAIIQKATAQAEYFVSTGKWDADLTEAAREGILRERDPGRITPLGNSVEDEQGMISSPDRRKNAGTREHPAG